jgi:hypothetical protein
VRYNQLSSDVKQLENRLRDLKKAFENTLNYEDPEQEKVLRSDLWDMVGDFRGIIDECQKVLDKNVKFSRNPAGFFDNIIWGAVTCDGVDKLRRDIQFYCQKIALVIEPVSHRMLGRTEEGAHQVSEQLGLLQTHLDIQAPLPKVPEWLAEKFLEMVFQNPPTEFEDLTKIPMKAGFDAMYSHFRDGIGRDAETDEQTPEQYLNLWKSQWLLETLRKGDEFQSAPSASLYRRTISHLEDRILKEHQKNDSVRLNDSDLRGLNTAAFLIWPVWQRVPDVLPTDQRPREQLILKLSLQTASGNDKDNLVVFRTGLTTMRIVRSLNRTGTISYEVERFNIHSDKFVPFYTIAGNSLTNAQRRLSASEWRSSATIYRSNDAAATPYEINGELNVLNFQRAFTGYQVVFDKSVDWAIHNSGKLPSGKGKLQIWNWNPLTDKNPAPGDSIPTPANPTTSVNSPESHLSKSLRGGDISLVSVQEKTETESAICGTVTPPPVLMIFTEDEGVYTYHHIECE